MGKQEQSDSGSIMLKIAAATEEYEMWERRWHDLKRMYALERCFVDRDGKWGLRDFLDYAGQVCGFEPHRETPQ